MKDKFSDQSYAYARYRPSYSEEIMNCVVSNTEGRERVWDCGTGNGQVATRLSPFFAEVQATDISRPQLQLAARADNVFYSVQPAERTNFPDKFFDLIVVSQAIHWFNFKHFYNEVNRTLRRDGTITVMGYDLPEFGGELDAVIHDFYANTLEKYWDAERRFIDEKYQTIPFPFPEKKLPNLSFAQAWNFDQLVGYLSTWSAVAEFQKQHHYNPVSTIKEKLWRAWGNTPVRMVDFPVLMRMGIME